MSTERHAVNVLLSEIDYVRLVREAAELTVREGRRVSIAELVRRLTLSEANQEGGKLMTSEHGDTHE